jgi:hypothetical protein
MLAGFSGVTKPKLQRRGVSETALKMAGCPRHSVKK